MRVPAAINEIETPDAAPSAARPTLYLGNSRAVLAQLADASIDACVTDPPYALVSIGNRFGKPGAADLKKAGRPKGEQDPYVRASRGFMGQQWDTGHTAHDPAFWREVHRVLKPGAHVVAFGGTRTYHRLACAIEDAGFDIRDMVAWLYGSGFPKSHDVSKGIDRAAGNKRPVIRPHGWGIGTNKTRVELGHRPSVVQQASYTAPGSPEAAAWEGWGTALKPALEPIVLARKALVGTVAANMLAHGTGALNIDASRVIVRWPANVVHDGSADVVEAFPATEASAARFFYTAKADAQDRLGSSHPTVKPVDLMRWLCKLVTPPGGTVLDPFAGTGATGLAAMGEGFASILIERDPVFFADMQRRFAWARGEGRLTAQETQRAGHDAHDTLPLFRGAP